jgi:hypothetical protein
MTKSMPRSGNIISTELLERIGAHRWLAYDPTNEPQWALLAEPPQSLPSPTAGTAPLRRLARLRGRACARGSCFARSVTGHTGGQRPWMRLRIGGQCRSTPPRSLHQPPAGKASETS